MSWANLYIKKLLEGETVKFRPRGNSMKGKIESGQLCTVEPIKNHDDLQPGDIVLCKVNGIQYLHLIKAIRHYPEKENKFCIGNNTSNNHVNGWTNARSIYGICVKVES